MSHQSLNLCAAVALCVLFAPPTKPAHAQTANMEVSVAKDEFGQGFAGPMVVQVVIDDDTINDTIERKGMPDVVVQGRILNMAQGTDGRWTGYFAALNPVRAADQTALDTGLTGLGLDYGVFITVTEDTPISVFGQEMFGSHPEFTETDAIALPQSGGLTAFANGISPVVIPEGAGSLTGSANLNNVVRNPPALNLNSDPAVPAGQIGLDINAWPPIALFDLPIGTDVVNVTYNVGSGAQILLLDYNQLSAPTITLDKDEYMPGDQVMLTIRDPQLNIDPTDPDSWTFNVTGPVSTFYQAFNADGSDSANGTAALTDLTPTLSDMGFDGRGALSMTLTSGIEFTTNDHQPTTSVNDGTDAAATFSTILTLAETGSNSGEFVSFDAMGQSILRIADDAAPGATVATIHYAGQSIPIKVAVPEPTTILIMTPALLTTLRRKRQPS